MKIFQYYLLLFIIMHLQRVINCSSALFAAKYFFLYSKDNNRSLYADRPICIRSLYFSFETLTLDEGERPSVMGLIDI